MRAPGRLLVSHLRDWLHDHAFDIPIVLIVVLAIGTMVGLFLSWMGE